MRGSVRMTKYNQKLQRPATIISFLFVLFLIAGCAGKTSSIEQHNSLSDTSKNAVTINKENSTLAQEQAQQPQTPPVQFRPQVQWKPSFNIKDVAIDQMASKLPDLKVGAEISTSGGKVSLREILGSMASLKDMNLSWASDVDQEALVSVRIKGDENFWLALENILRPLDYFFEYKDNTIIVKYKDTKRFFLPMPFLTASYKSSVGGDLLGNDETTAGLMKGTLSVENNDESIDLWATIQDNLDRILQLASVQVSTNTELDKEQEAKIRQECQKLYPAHPAQQALCVEQKRQALEEKQKEAAKKDETTKKTVAADSGKKGDREGFFYTIDKPLGIITVTAPRSILSKVEAYLNAIKKEMSRQVLIEAKIIEVYLSENTRQGIDWETLWQEEGHAFNASITFGNLGTIYPKDNIKLIGTVDLVTDPFNIILRALKEYGKVKILSNPKITLLNGQPAMITVGESIRYVDSVTSTIDSETGIITYTVETKSLLSGLGLGVVANIASNDEVVLHLTPVTSKLQELAYEYFGGNLNRVGLPRIFLREMSTMARVKNGQLLILGGLIDDEVNKDHSKVPVLGDLPIVGGAFKYKNDYSVKRELVILLRPQIITL